MCFHQLPFAPRICEKKTNRRENEKSQCERKAFNNRGLIVLKKDMAYIDKSLHSARNMHRYLSADINCSKKRTVFRASLEENVEL